MRRGHIVVSMLVAVLGLAAMFVAQPWPGQSSQSDPASVAAPQAPMKTIVVAVRPLRIGTEIKQEHLKEVEWAETDIPSGAYASVSDFLDGEVRAVMSPIKRDEPVVSWMVTGSGERAINDLRAIPISVSDVRGVTGVALPGDHVDVMLTRSGHTEILLQNIKILAIDRLADERAEQPKSDRTVTVEVNKADARKLTLAQTAGTLSLALRAAGSVEAATRRRITMKDLGAPSGFYCEEQGGIHYLVLCRPDRIPRVGVIRGMSRETYVVPQLDSDAPLENRSFSGK